MTSPSAYQPRLRRITSSQKHALYNVAGTRAIEAQAQAALPPHTLMQRAGQAIAQLACALAPHAQQYWIACGLGNNGGDGLEAAYLLHKARRPVCVSWLGDTPNASKNLPSDADRSWQRAHSAGVPFVPKPPLLGPQDLAVDALLGIGLRDASSTPVSPLLLDWLAHLRTSAAMQLHVDLPSGLLADTGQWAKGFSPLSPAPLGRRHTLALLALHPGLFTAHGQDACGNIWLDRLLCHTPASNVPISATLQGKPAITLRPHTSHKGSFGDVAIVGGQGLAAHGASMTGAALLAASAALYAGAGRVLLSLLDEGATTNLTHQPELMLRHPKALDPRHCTVVAGCGGGHAIAPLLPKLMEHSARLILDADALNAIAEQPSLQTQLRQRQQPSILTPHPLEAARLLHTNTNHVQSDRLAAAQALAERYHCVVVLKGSGSVIAAPQHLPILNPTGNARLACAGTGDVLAGWLGAHVAALSPAKPAPHLSLTQLQTCAAQTCWLHGHSADRWAQPHSLTASALACTAQPA